MLWNWKYNASSAYEWGLKSYEVAEIMTGRKSQGLYSGHYNMKRLKEKAYNGDEKDQSVRKEIKSSWHPQSGVNKAGYRGEHDDVFSASA